MSSRRSNPLRDPQDRRLPKVAGPCGMVIFGVTGDLARKKLMPAIYDLANRGLLPPGFSLVGFARRDWADQDFAKVVHDAVKEHARTEFREEVWNQLAEGFRFVPGDFDDDQAFDHLRQTIDDLDRLRGTGGNHAFYLSIPPRFFGNVIGQLKEHGLDRGHRRTPGAGWWSRSRSAPTSRPRRSSTRCSSEVFPPESVFRIDHYLGKETVQNILAMRFANMMFEPIWNSNYVDHVQITMAEDIGIGGRAGYYDGIGAARDVIQNHLLQLLALTAMEEPTSFDARSLHMEKLKVLESVVLPRRIDLSTARGQYAAGWAGGVKVARLPRRARHPDDSRRPRRTPRSGSASTTGAGRACRSTCAPASGSAAGSPRSPCSSRRPRTCPSTRPATETLTHNALVIRVQPDEGITLRFGSKVPGTQMEIRDVNMDFAYGGSFTEASPEAYERLILDVLLGEPPLFPRHEEVEQSWRILDPIIDYWADHGKPEQYPSGTWGPSSADEMLAREGRTWRRP